MVGVDVLPDCRRWILSGLGDNVVFLLDHKLDMPDHRHVSRWWDIAPWKTWLFYPDPDHFMITGYFRSRVIM